jgi:predicted  nucleic acid-binding Zn-ribbon protein
VLDDLRRLLDLQKLDHELRAFEAEHGALPERRRRVEEARAGAETRLATAREALAAAEAGQRRCETALQDHEALLRKLEGQQHQVKTNLAYTALLHEMDASRAAISDCETRILEAMEVIEGARGELRAAEAGAERARAELEAESRALEAREKELDAGIARLRGIRDAATPGIEPRLLAQYEKIAARSWPAVVFVRNEVCGGCKMDIPSQSFIEILRGERVVICGNCRRILLAGDRDLPAS